MKILKYIAVFIIGVFLILLIAVGVLIYFDDSDAEYSKRKLLAAQAISQINAYFDKHGIYPDDLSVLPISGNSEFISYYQKHAFRYSAYKGATPKYELFWNRDKLGWTAYHCTNDKSTLDAHMYSLPYGMTPDAMGCYTIDRH